MCLLEPRGGRYRGRLCSYGQCPKGKPECEAAGCGAQPFLQQIEEFRFDHTSLYHDWVVTLFARPATPPADGDVPF